MKLTFSSDDMPAHIKAYVVDRYNRLPDDAKNQFPTFKKAATSSDIFDHRKLRNEHLYVANLFSQLFPDEVTDYDVDDIEEYIRRQSADPEHQFIVWIDNRVELYKAKKTISTMLKNWQEDATMDRSFFEELRVDLNAEIEKIVANLGKK